MKYTNSVDFEERREIEEEDKRLRGVIRGMGVMFEKYIMMLK